MDTLALPFEFKTIDDAGHVEGIAAAFGNVDIGGDRIMPSAFTKTLGARAGAPVPMLLHHDHKRPVGAWTELTQTANGLLAKGRITLAARDGAEAYALAKDGALRGLSIGYQASRKAMVGSVRELHEIDLHEVSLVTIGMNPLAVVTSLKALATPGDFEDLFRERGLSGRQAKAAASAAWKSINDGKDDDEAEARAAAIFNASAARIAAMGATR